MYSFSKVLRSYSTYKSVLDREPAKIVEFIDTFLSQIERYRDLNAFARVYDSEVRERALLLRDRLSVGKVGRLGGMVVGLKDMFCYKGHVVQGSSAILDGFVAQFDASVVARLLGEDAIIIGHQNGDEFGMGSGSEHSVYGRVYNALDVNRVAGGSSGGSAAALQGGMCHVSLGTDTGGSVRQPAAFCGVIGLKPTYGLIPRDGVLPYASSFDTVGILGHEVEDCARVLGVIAGESRYDNTSSSRVVPDYVSGLSWGGEGRVAYFKEVLEGEGLDPCIRRGYEELLNRLRREGHEVCGVEFPLLDCALPTYYVLTTAEASSNLARYDGVRYGYRTAKDRAYSLEAMYKHTRTEGFGEEVQRRILLGTFVLSSSYYEAYYLQAQKVRRLIKEYMEEVLRKFDFIILPTTPTTAFLHDRAVRDVTREYLADLYTVPASLAGLPAISLPYGRDKGGLPMGMQVVAGAFEESRLLAFSKYILGLSRG